MSRVVATKGDVAGCDRDPRHEQEDLPAMDTITLTKSQAETIWFFLREYYWKWSKDREHD